MNRTIREHTLERLRRKKPDLMPLLLSLLENWNLVIKDEKILYEHVPPSRDMGWNDGGTVRR
ncbi:hypothetical protein J6590_066519 [Homalodisca vitripennis]|nr:hypothetical protein J6590_066519 [Homalodisca vitripennis]